MCGIAGFLGTTTPDGDEAVLRRMAQCLRHRGPSHAAVWHDRKLGVGLAHSRLAIIDLSPAGHQPMKSASDRYVLVFNGEIYNHLDLRRDIEQTALSPRWRGHSDTETLLAGFDAWGIEATLQKSIGMFAFAVWDTEQHHMVLGRDRFGEKPLYYGWQRRDGSEIFLFASELKALRLHPAFEAEIDREALTTFMRHGYVPAPQCIYRGLAKLRPGTLATVSPGRREAVTTTYYSAANAVEIGAREPFQGNADDAVIRLEELLSDAVRKQMIADVPLGAFLSGGIDSSTIVALMQSMSTRPVRTFSIGFHEPGYNEAHHAKAVAEYLGTEHTELYVTAEQAVGVVPRLPSIYDEPFADSSQIPTLLVSELARRDVAVSLSGDAADELFAGYQRYYLADSIWTRLSILPRGLRRGLGVGCRKISPGWANKVARAGSNLTRGRLSVANAGHKLQKAAGIIGADTSSALYQGMMSHWFDPAALVIEGKDTFDLTADWESLPEGTDDFQRMMLADLTCYLPDDILTKVDRAAMAVSLETRMPMLDHRVVEFACSLQMSVKYRNGQAKWPLKAVLYRYLPPALVNRPKMGFGVPIDTWLRGSLKSWAADLLAPSRLDTAGYLHAKPVRDLWDLHQSHTADVQYELWDVLMFQAWLEERENDWIARDESRLSASDQRGPEALSLR